MRPIVILPSSPTADDPILHFQLEERASMTLLRLVLCAALALAILALASGLLP